MFVRAPNPIWYMVDLTGLPLDDTYYAFFLQNTLPYNFQAVYQDFEGIYPWSNPIQFQPSGTLPNNLYFDPSLVYRIEIRQGSTTADPLIWQIENFVPESANTNSQDNLLNGDNQISNSQFSQIDFISPLIFTKTAGTYTIDVAPGWQLFLTGAGTTTLTQLELPGNDENPGNPPFALRINNSGWTTAVLSQTFSENGAIFMGGAISMSITARAIVLPQTITLNYVSSNGQSIPPILSSATVITDVFDVYAGAITLPESTNPNEGDAAFVQMQIVLQGTGEIDITNVQILGQSSPLPDDFIASDIPAYREETIERQIDQLFHYYQTGLNYKPIRGYLVGWDFPLNPAQLLTSTVAAQATGANTSYYAWDQTIIFQTATSSATIARGTSGEFVMTAAKTCQLAVVQYLDASQVKRILNNPISVNLAANCNIANGLTGTVSLWYTSAASLPDMTANNSLIATISAAGKPSTFNGAPGDWTEIPTRNNQDATFTIAQSGASTNFPNIPFDGWWNLDGDEDETTATFFAIVIGFASVANMNSISLYSVNCCPGYVATIPAPQTLDEVLAECQFYYEKSYSTQVLPGAITNTGMNFQVAPWVAISTNCSLSRKSFELNYNVNKRIAPTTNFYSPASATINQVQMGLLIAGSAVGTGFVNVATSDWTANASLRNILMVPKTTGEVNVVTFSAAGGNLRDVEGVLYYHYVSDARLGIV